jgi:hypothetical protein
MKKYLIFLIFIIILSSCLGPYFIKEFYINNDTLPLKSLNNCGRQLEFPNQVSSNVLASIRSKLNDKNWSNPKGICSTNGTRNDVDSSYSVIVENGLYYSLHRACIGLRTLNFGIDNDNNIFITFLHETTSDKDNMLLLLLLNPLYIEFTKNNGTASIGYGIVYETYNKDFTKLTNGYNNTKTFLYSNTYTDNYKIPINNKNKDNIIRM